MLRAISLRESWMREIRTSGLTRERAPNGPSLLYIFDSVLCRHTKSASATTAFKIEDEDEDDLVVATPNYDKSDHCSNRGPVSKHRFVCSCESGAGCSEPVHSRVSR